MTYMVAIVEDNDAEAAILESHFKRYQESADIQFSLTRFRDGSEFITNYHPVYDLVMLDVNLPKVNGMDAAICLRRVDPSVALIFVTSMIQYAVKGYEVDVMDFMLKPVSYQSFSQKMQRTIQRLQQRKGMDLLIPMQDGMYRISTSRIKYIEVTNHSLIYHTSEGDISTRGKLNDVEAQIHDPTFIRCNRCYLVNLAFVKTIRGSELVVDPDAWQISRPKRAAVLEALNNYLGGSV